MHRIVSVNTIYTLVIDQYSFFLSLQLDIITCCIKVNLVGLGRNF